MFKMLESQNPGFRVLNLKTRVPKFMRKPGFSGSGSNPGSIPKFYMPGLWFAILHFFHIFSIKHLPFDLLTSEKIPYQYQKSQIIF